MGLGGKLLKAQLGAGLAAGPLQAQENEMALLQKRLAQQFANQQMVTQGSITRQNDINRANLGAETDPSRLPPGASPALAQANQVDQRYKTAMADQAVAGARVATETVDDEILIRRNAAQQSLKNLKLTDMNIDSIRIANQWDAEKFDSWTRTLPWVEQAIKYDSKMKGEDWEIRGLLNRSLLDLRAAQIGGLKADRDFTRARENAAQLESKMLQRLGANPALVNPENFGEMARLAVSNQSAAKQANERFLALMGELALRNVPGRDGELIPEFTIATVEELVGSLQFHPDAGDNARIRKQVLEHMTQWAQGPDAGLLFGFFADDQQNALAALSSEEAFDQALKAAGVPTDTQTAMELLRDAYYRQSGIDPESVSRGANLINMAFPEDPQTALGGGGQGGPGGAPMPGMGGMGMQGPPPPGQGMPTPSMMQQGQQAQGGMDMAQIQQMIQALPVEQQIALLQALGGGQ